ncbi:lysozyme family protein [Pseudooceanicola spongiae]|uniref:Transglycosylase SLT domain-containing protein n=1 Tax=Pseudooceanicola spongiae TaxID=2613965 RepID=A0A7L9WL42_9RHOB|nr:hypothetical protein [Pseudooceanicola spongiae]QOL79770.1 hypothetical protein F3W81_02415 [Pseudooceanicola spongiae]
MLLRFCAKVRCCLILLALWGGLSAAPGLATPVSLLAPQGAEAAPLSAQPRRAALLPDLGSVAPGQALADRPPADTNTGASAGDIAAAVARDLLRQAQSDPAPKSAMPPLMQTLNNIAQPTGVIQTSAKTPVVNHVSSLFSGRSATSLFAPSTRVRPSRGKAAFAAPGYTPLLSGSHAQRLKHLIASVESHRDGYDAVQYAATVRPAKRPTQMTLQEIYDWTTATPGQQHAIGRYQIIPKTLKYLVASLGTDPREVFSPALQDRFADKLLQDAGYHDFLSNQLSRHDFMHNLSQVWAGLPSASGKSYYHGLAGNRASMTWARFDAEMARIFPG